MILEDDSIADKEQIRELITEEKDPDMREKKSRTCSLNTILTSDINTTPSFAVWIFVTTCVEGI